VNHDQNTVFAHTANGMPALFAILDTIEDDGQMRVREDELREWLDEYLLSELWEKNVIGGGPLS